MSRRVRAGSGLRRWFPWFETPEEEEIDQFTASIPQAMRARDTEWDEEENRSGEEITVGADISDAGITVASIQPSVGETFRIQVDDSIPNGYINLQYSGSNSGTISWIDDNNQLHTHVDLRGGMIATVQEAREPISIMLNREQYEVDILEDRIEIRRRFDDENNDNGTHDEPTSDGVQRSENMLQQWDTEQ